MAELRKTKRFQGIAIATAIMGLVVVIGYVCDLQSTSPVEPSPIPAPAESRPTNEADGDQTSAGGPLLLGSLLGSNRPAPPPASISVGRSSEETDAPDLSTPGAAVYSVLSLIDQGATDKLAPCLFEETAEPVSSLYPCYLGPPVGLAEVTEDDQSAKVVWNATVHTAFSRPGKRWSPGESMTLTARLVRVEGLWKLQRLHEGDDDGSESRDAPAK